MIVLNGKHLRRVLKEYFAYYHESRTHLGLEKDSPDSRFIQGRNIGQVGSTPGLDGLHHRYYREAA
jgi:hypothetical protein